ncbi:sigma-54-dependent Fis family transcriptional regulator [Prosthecochloris sp. ZM]|nr:MULTISPECIES: sigma-54 dependent transcriptional regulator [unclassified Prosthecochloris]NEX12769.1 sigma-54-dependent Fis family transcriptional regulator [Prosthecochloris sp.]RDD30375.1 sigma-54-dependent Fis family transcriptional regulator [Prosthecochloris sp. ZM]
MPSSILVIGTEQKQRASRQSSTSSRRLQVRYAKTLADAENLFKTYQPHLLLIALNHDPLQHCSFARKAVQCHPRLKTMLFNSDDELDLTLQGLDQLPAAQFAALFCSGNDIGKRQNEQQNMPHCFNDDDLVGNSPETKKIKDLIVTIAPGITTILLQGETGTGKEVIARSIHRHSERKDRIFMPVDCAAINESVIESELFGHAKGSFTSADRSTLGLIRSADGGTLFLDEIGELSRAMQAKLLRTLQERSVKPVGSSRIYPVDIRIIAATNRNLSEAVKNEIFRKDLYYRLNTVTIYAPPLRERVCDIADLCAQFAVNLEQEGYPLKTISDKAIDILCAYDWPGNIRELENVIRSAVILSKSKVIEPHDIDLPNDVSDRMTSHSHTAQSTVAFHEKEAIRKALNHTIGNRRAAAKLLGISEATLYRRIKLYSI